MLFCLLSSTTRCNLAVAIYDERGQPLSIIRRAAGGINSKSLSRYELGTSIPPANALKTIADALGVSADYLLSDKEVNIKDKNLLKKFEVVQNMPEDEKKLVNYFLDMVIRDYSAKQAYK